MNRVPFPEELPVIDLVDTGDALRQDRFPGPVIAAEGGDLPGIEVQVDLGEGLYRAKMLVDAAGFEPWLAQGGFFDYLAHRITLSRAMGGWRRRERRRRHNGLANSRCAAGGRSCVGAQLRLVDELILNHGRVHVRGRDPDRHQQ